VETNRRVELFFPPSSIFFFFFSSFPPVEPRPPWLGEQVVVSLPFLFSLPGRWGKTGTARKGLAVLPLFLSSERLACQKKTTCRYLTLSFFFIFKWKRGLEATHCGSFSPLPFFFFLPS